MTKKVDMFAYEGPNDLTKKEMSDLEEILEKKKIYLINYRMILKQYFML